MTTPNFLFKKYVPSILEQFEKNLGLDKEFEIRFHQLVKPKDRSKPWYESPLDLSSFIRIKNYLINKYGTPTEIHSEDKIKSGKRQSLIMTDSGEEKVITISKNRIWDSKKYDFDNFRGLDLFKEIGIRLSMSSEVETTEGEFKDPDIIRNKHRYSWKDGIFQYDITQITSTEKGKGSFPSWEVEIEIIHPIFQGRSAHLNQQEKEMIMVIMYKLYLQATTLLKVINNTDLVYRRVEMESVQQFVNDSVNDGNDRLENFIVKARDLKYQDMVYGGLIGGKYQYTITPKAEGLRKFLIVHGYGVWLIYPGKEYCLVDKPPADANKYREWKWYPYIGTILDGEEILPENLKPESGYTDINHFYLPFDTLFFKNEDVRNRNLTERLKLADILRNSIGSSSSLVIKSKPFTPIGKTANEFFEIVGKSLKYNESLEYNTDGVMLTPINTSYNPGSDKIANPKNRTLVNYPDICKWKPADLYTIDLKVKRTPSKRAVYSSWGSDDVEFKGLPKIPFDSETQIDWYDPMFANIPNGTIVEFGPKLNSSGNKVLTENGGIILRPVRIREDKTFANSKIVAVDVWADLNDPITEQTITGKSNRLVRKYHNRIKRELLSTPQGMDNHLIDIGSGKGGDIGKMFKFSRILSIEPNIENMNEFKRRLSTESVEIQNKFATLVAGGEEYERIIEAIRATFGDSFGRKPLYISMMLSLSFFWKSKEMLQQLANTLNLIKEEYYRSVPKDLKGKNTVKFLFLTIEGERVVKFLNENGSEIQLNEAYFSYKDGVVYMDFPGTIVEKQIEYPVILSELRELTDMSINFERDATEEKFLSENEKKYTSLYVYGSYDLPNKPFYLFRKAEEEIFNSDVVLPEETEEIIVKVPSNNTLFASLYSALNPSDIPNIKPEYVLFYRKEVADGIANTNPFDVESRSIFESAGNGFLKNINEDIDYAKRWIFSEHELPPEYISWIPDTIGANLIINGKEYKTSLPSGITISLEYNYSTKSYSLI